MPNSRLMVSSTRQRMVAKWIEQQEGLFSVPSHVKTLRQIHIYMFVDICIYIYRERYVRICVCTYCIYTDILREHVSV